MKPHRLDMRSAKRSVRCFASFYLRHVWWIVSRGPSALFVVTP